jgi:hypothetical protein
MHYSPEPMRPRNRGGKTSKRQREYLPSAPLYVNPLPLVEPKAAKEPTPKRKRVVLSRHFAENFIAGVGFAGGVFVFAMIAVYLISGRF